MSSVTWKSLLSFFSAKRLPIGRSDDDALVVDGKLSKIGVKSEFSSFCSSCGFCFALILVEDSTPRVLFFCLVPEKVEGDWRVFSFIFLGLK